MHVFSAILYDAILWIRGCFQTHYSQDSNIQEDIVLIFHVVSLKVVNGTFG